jgi:hypothetical protein
MCAERRRIAVSAGMASPNLSHDGGGGATWQMIQFGTVG